MLTIDTFKKILENEYIEMAVTILLVIAIVFGFWYGSQLVLNTPNPALAVVSTSMQPTLNVGDLIIVQGVDPAHINAQYTTGDIVVFEHPKTGDLIVHRAVKLENRSDGYWITTHGDNNRPSEESFHESDLIGKVVAKIPYIGNFTLIIQALGDIYFFIVLMIILVAIFLTFSLGAGGEEKSNRKKQKHENWKLFGKLDIGIIYLLIEILLIISFMVFSLWGALTFWQPGAKPQQYVAIRGMYSDLQYYGSFNKSYNNVEEAFLSQNFFSYRIDCLVDGVTRPGVPTFSWAQASVFILLILSAWIMVNFLKRRKTLVPKTET